MIYPIYKYNSHKIFSKDNRSIIWINPSQVTVIKPVSKELYEVHIADTTIFIDQESFEWLKKQ